MPRPTDQWTTYSPRSYIYHSRCNFCQERPKPGPRGGTLRLASFNPGWQYRARLGLRYGTEEGETTLIRCPACAAAGRGDEKGGPDG